MFYVIGPCYVPVHSFFTTPLREFLLFSGLMNMICISGSLIGVCVSRSALMNRGIESVESEDMLGIGN